MINCGWNNNVAVKIVACWNRNVFTSSSWLDRHGELVFTIHVRRDPPHSNSPVRSSILWVTGWLIWFRPLKLTFSTLCCCCLAWTQCCLRVWQKDGRWGVLGMVTEGGDWVTRTSHFYRSHKGSWKGTVTCRLCALYCGLTVLKLIWYLHIP